MKHKAFLAALAVAGTLAFSPAIAATDPVVARVNGEEIHRSDVLHEIEMAGPALQQLPPAIIFPQLLKKMVATKVVAQKGYAEGLDKSDTVKEKLKQLEAQVVAETYIHKQVEPKITEDKIKARYKLLESKFKPQDEVRARHILVKTKKEADDLIAKLKKGADFSKLAEENSKDTGSAKQGGDLGYFVRDAMVKPFADAAFKLKKGEISDSPVKTEFGYHVIKVEDRRKSSPPPLADVRDQIANQLGQELTNEEVNTLTSKAKIEMFQMDGSPINKEKGENKK
ncbi:MAG: peptidylprolyl isomerase [Alphaproteobacteria bacterium]|nr:peptidylprolyl isomerase [Alphaproteobacteria bacterium]